MTESQVFHKNAMLGIEFDKYLIEHPELAEKIPDDAFIVIMPHDDPVLCKANKKLAETMRTEGHNVLLVNVQKIKPPQKSRLVRPKLELAMA